MINEWYLTGTVKEGNAKSLSGPTTAGPAKQAGRSDAQEGREEYLMLYELIRNAQEGREEYLMLYRLFRITDGSWTTCGTN